MKMISMPLLHNSGNETELSLPVPSTEKNKYLQWSDTPAIAARLKHLSNGSSFHLFVLLVCRMIIAGYLSSGENQYVLFLPGQKPLPVTINDDSTIKQLILQIAAMVKETGYNQNNKWVLCHGNKAAYDTNSHNKWGIGVTLDNADDDMYDQRPDTDLNFLFSFEGDHLRANIIYNELLYPPAFIVLAAERFREAGEWFTEVNRPLGSLDRVGIYENKLIDGFGKKEICFNYDHTVSHYLEMGAARHPFRTAVICNDLHLTYSEVNKKANRIARLLLQAGAGPNSLVAFWMERSAEMMVAILGIWKAGAAYVPMDHKDPEDRTGYLLRDASINIVITRQALFTAGDHVYEALATVQHVICVDSLHNITMHQQRLNTFRTAWLLQNGIEKTISRNAVFQYGNQVVTAAELIRQAEKIITALAQWQVQRIGICTVNPVCTILACMAAHQLKKEIIRLPADAPLIKEKTEEQAIDTIFTESLLASRTDLVLRMNGALKQYLLLDEYQSGEQVKQHQVKQVWDMVAASTSFAINDYGWNNSYTGEKFSEAEMKEYVDNFSQKLQPYINDNKIVLEVGCGHGLVLFEIAPKAKQYVATDLTPVIIDRNIKKAAEAGFLNNTSFHALAACDIDKLQHRNFDVIICSSVIHYFPDTLYFDAVVRKMIALLAEQGIIYLDDIINLDKKQELIDSVMAYKATHPEKKVKTNWDGDLMISPSFFMDMQAFYPEIVCIEITDKLGKQENELTKFRFDVVLHIDKRRSAAAVKSTPKRNYLTKSEWEKAEPKAGSTLSAMVEHSNVTLYDSSDIDQYDAGNVPTSFNPAQIAYLIYTSGSTGKPKGAIVEHQGMMNHLFSKILDTRFRENDVLAQVATHTFDISIWQFFTPVIAGARTVIIPEEKIFHVHSFVHAINASGVTILELVPSYLSLLPEAASRFSSSLRYLFITGEEVKPELVKRTARNYPWLKIINAYGPTEASDDITHCFIDADAIADKVPIGKPLPNCTIRIVNERFEPCAVGMAGEIWVTGVCVGKGYLNEIEKTHAAFVHHSFGSNAAERYYRTGDLGKWLYNGEIEFLQRKDEQVKIHGHRVELGEVENCLLQLPAVKNAVVILKHEKNGNTLLGAFYESEDELPMQYLRAHMAGRLPAYMIPALFKRIDKIPQTSNGKVDKKALDAISISDPYLRFLTTKELERFSALPAAYSQTNGLPSISEEKPEPALQENGLVMHEFNKPVFASEALFTDLFLQKVKTHGDRVAVSFRNENVTYSALDEQSSRLAAALISTGIQPQTIVAVCVERSVDSIVTLLGVIRAGAIYLFIEPSWPAERVRYVLHDSGASFVVTTTQLKQRVFDALAAPVTVLDTATLQAYDGAVLPADIQPAPHDAVYTMYTSGSTGRPNGVLVEHRNLGSFLLTWQQAWQVDHNDKLLLISSLTFDVSIADIGAALISGATMVICTEQDLVRPNELIEIICQSGITIIDSVPSLVVMLGKLIAEKQLGLPALRLIIGGGDVFRTSDYNQLRQWLQPSIQIVNGYGPTEATIYASSYIPQGMEDTGITSLSIGKPGAHVNMYIVDAQNRLLPVNAAGELVIAGAGVARGYLNKVELTAEKFSTIRLLGLSDQKIYRTGDYAQWRTDGCIEFLGRNDQQVKINGYRVGLPEIEKVLIDHALISEAVVLLRSGVEEVPVLVAYIVAEERLMTEEVRRHLAGALPSYMVPSFVIQLEGIPLTANGKRDRGKLQQIDPNEIVTTFNEGSRNNCDEQLRGIWAEILGIDKSRIGPESDYFELGATSFEVIVLASRIKETFRVDIPVNIIFAKSKLKAVSDQIAAGSIDSDYMVLNEQTDDKLKTLFLFPPLAAYGFIYAPFKEHFPAYSLYAFNFIEEDDRIERYVRLIREKQPHGPYTLIGYSAPGEMMAEIAASLENGGEKVRLLFIDCARTSRYGRYFREKYVQQLEQAVAAQKNALRNYGLDVFEKKLEKKVTRYFEYLAEPVELKSLSADICVIAATDRPETLQQHAKEIIASPGSSFGKQRENIVSHINWEHCTKGSYIMKQGHGRHDEMLTGNNLFSNITLIKRLISFAE